MHYFKHLLVQTLLVIALISAQVASVYDVVHVVKDLDVGGQGLVDLPAVVADLRLPVLLLPHLLVALCLSRLSTGCQVLSI